MDTTILKEKFEKVSKDIAKNQWPFFHRGSLLNFVYSVDLIGDNTLKENTSQILFNCLTDVELNFEPDVDYSIYLFNTYLKCLLPTYRNLLGFSAIPNKNAIYVFAVAVVMIFTFLFNNVLLEVLFCAAIILISYKKVNNFRRHRVYGFMSRPGFTLQVFNINPEYT